MHVSFYFKIIYYLMFTLIIFNLLQFNLFFLVLQTVYKRRALKAAGAVISTPNKGKKVKLGDIENSKYYFIFILLFYWNKFMPFVFE